MRRSVSSESSHRHPGAFFLIAHLADLHPGKRSASAGRHALNTAQRFLHSISMVLPVPTHDTDSYLRGMGQAPTMKLACTFVISLSVILMAHCIIHLLAFCLQAKLDSMHSAPSAYEKATIARELRLETMESARGVCDSTEAIMPANLWPMATYKDLLFLDYTQ